MVLLDPARGFCLLGVHRAGAAETFMGVVDVVCAL